jgi:hypothetical protein
VTPEEGGLLLALLEVIGFALLVAAAATVSPGLAYLVAGLTLVLLANRPTPKRPTRPRR